MIIDSYGEGMPVAWLLSNRDDFLVRRVFFAAIKERIGDLTCSTFMSDDAEQFYSVWSSVFTKPNYKLICSWHVDKN